jgi:hypothetical protein
MIPVTSVDNDRNAPPAAKRRSTRSRLFRRDSRPAFLAAENVERSRSCRRFSLDRPIEMTGHHATGAVAWLSARSGKNASRRGKRA